MKQIVFTAESSVVGKIVFIYVLTDLIFSGGLSSSPTTVETSNVTVVCVLLENMCP